MMPKRVSDRVSRSLAKFQQVLQIAKDRDVNESDTVSIIKDMLAEIFGYDKYLEITSEFAIRGTYCDLAIKIDDKIEFLIEAKAIGTDLKDSHLRQALDYGANKGVQWVILTNSIIWNIYKIRFEQPINYDFVCSVNVLELNVKNEEHIYKLFLICKEGLIKDKREEYFDKMQILNRFILGSLLLSDEVLSVIRRELRKISDGLIFESDEIYEALSSEVIKRDVLEGEEAEKAQSRIRKFYDKQSRKSRETSSEKEIPCEKEAIQENLSFSDKLLKESENPQVS